MPQKYESWSDMPNVFEPAQSGSHAPSAPADAQDDVTPLSQEQAVMQEQVAEQAPVVLREQASAAGEGAGSIDDAAAAAADSVAAPGNEAVGVGDVAAAVSGQAAAAGQAYQAPATQQAQAYYQAPAYQAAPQAAAYQAMPQAPVYQAGPQVAYQAPVQKKSRGWIVAIVVIVCLFALMAFSIQACSDMVVNTAGVYGQSPAGTSGDTVAVIDIDGTIQYDGSACSPEGFKKLLDEASSDSNIKALVLRVNSGGGTATAGEEMASYLRDFEKPVVVSSASINASAAYEISSQANYIYVAKSTEIGAIGTAMQVTDMSGLLEMLGIDMDVITSADSKDSSYGYRPLSEEERAYYQRMVDQINDTFVENVATGRSLSMEEARALATGLPFTGIDAVQNGIADEVGTLEDAVAKAAELAGITDYDTYKLGFNSYSLATLYDLLGSTQGENQTVLPLLKQ